FYLAALRKRDGVRLAWSAGCLAMGCLVHFAGVPYAAFVALHCIVSILHGRSPNWRAAVVSVLCGVAVLASWYGYTALAFGPRANLAANPTLGFFAKHSTHENFERVASNVVNTLIPLPLRMRGTWFVQPSRLGHIRDHAFMAYEDNFLLSMGC